MLKNDRAASAHLGAAEEPLIELGNQFSFGARKFLKFIKFIAFFLCRNASCRRLVDNPNSRTRSPRPNIQMGDSGGGTEVTYKSLEHVLRNDNKVKVAGIDIDGVLRGKLMSKKKFLGIAKEGFGFCSVIFGWDMHDQTYFKELKISNAENGYHDIIAVPDLSSFRRIPWEDDVPFFLVSFLDPNHRGPISACPRGLLKTAVDRLEKQGLGAMAGGETCEPSTDILVYKMSRLCLAGLC